MTLGIGVNANPLQHQTGYTNEQEEQQRQAVPHAVLEIVQHVFFVRTVQRCRPLDVAAIQKQSARSDKQHATRVQNKLIDLVEHAKIEVHGRVML